RPYVSQITNAYVARLETSPSGREGTRVVVERNGAPESYSADVIVVSCGAINSAALLLRSANAQHPNGLANRSDVVGRHYMCHVNGVMLAISRAPNPTIFQKTLPLTASTTAPKTWTSASGPTPCSARPAATSSAPDPRPLSPGIT